MINISKKTIKLSGILLIITMLIVIFSLCIGEVMINPLDALKSILGMDVGFSSILVMDIRLPRILVAFFCWSIFSIIRSYTSGSG